MMKKFPGYRKALKKASQKTVSDLEEMFQRKWDKDDETLNDGEKSYDDDEDDDIYND